MHSKWKVLTWNHLFISSPVTLKILNLLSCFHLSSWIYRGEPPHLVRERSVSYIASLIFFFSFNLSFDSTFQRCIFPCPVWIMTQSLFKHVHPKILHCVHLELVSLMLFSSGYSYQNSGLSRITFLIKFMFFSSWYSTFLNCSHFYPFNAS